MKTKNKAFKINRLSQRLWLFMFFQALVLVLFVSIFSYYSAASAMQKEALSFSEEILGMKADSMDDYMIHMEQYSQDVLYESAIYSVLESARHIDRRSIFIERDIKEVLDADGSPIMSLFSNIIISREEIQSIALIDNEGLIWVYDNDDSKKTEIQELIDDEMFQNISERAMTAHGRQEVYLNTVDGVTEDIFFSRVIYSPENYQQLGYLVLLADRDYFKSLIESGMTDNAFHVMLYDIGGQPVYAAGQEQYGNAVLRFLDSDVQWEVNRFKGVLFVRTDMKNSDWAMVSAQALDILYADIIRLRGFLIAYSVGLVLLFAFLSWIFSKDTVKPVQTLTEAMKRVRSGESGVDVAVDRDDELGYMSETFNTMVRQNERLVKTIYREQITKKDAELQALQSQINPHFLFNTLETISWTARLKHVDEISDIVEDLAEIMKAGIGKGDALIKIKTEIAYIDRYLSIMKKRFEKRLQVIKKIDKALYGYKIPKLLIQPLIENAIYHGIDKQREGGCVFIGVSRKNAEVHISVCNSGKGISEEEVSRINKGLLRPSDEYFYNLKENQLENVGLENVNRRIKLYYGEDYGICVSSSYGHYTKVVGVLPIEGIIEGDDDV